VGDSGDGLDSLNAGVAAGDVEAAVLVGIRTEDLAAKMEH
jgi:hypothetical protein